MLKISIDQTAMNRLKATVSELGLNLKKEFGASVNKVAKKVAFEASKEIGKELAVKPRKLLKKVVNTGKKATADYPFAIVYLNQGYPFPLKYFGAKQTKKGVTYKLKPTYNRNIARDMFIVKQYGGHVYRRQNATERYPLRRVFGPKPGDVYEATNLPDKMAKVATEQLTKQLNERVRYLTQRAQGKLR
jgi:hypothetical protein